MVIITIGGPAGSGKSTVGRLLAQRLGIPFYSMGDVKREYAREMGIDILELNKVEEQNPTTDRKVDAYQSELPKSHPSFVIDSRLGFHFLPKSVKLYITVDKRVGAQRILAAKRTTEGWSTVEEGIKVNDARLASERLRYGQLYGIDHTDTKQYDLVLDSTDKTVEQLVDAVLEFLERAENEG